jgi:rhamnosyl/mannosyltransferase
MLLALAAARPRVPLVISHHSDVVRQKKLALALYPFEAWAYRRAAAILAASPAYAKASPRLQRHAARVQVVPYGLDVDRLRQPSPTALEWAARLRAKLGTPLWLTVGRLVYYKGLPTALKALREVPGRLLVIGEGPLAGALRQQSRELGVSERVVFRGRADGDELVGAYQAATALWFPSNARSEAFGLVQVEAMASGCPVINTAVPDSGVAWVSRHEQSGLTVPVDDAAALARGARRLIDEPGLRDRLGSAGRARACQEFDDETMARRTLAVYQASVSASRGRTALRATLAPESEADSTTWSTP